MTVWRHNVINRILCSLTLVPVFLSAGCSPQTAALPGDDARIQYYSDRVSAHPRLYAAYAQLAAAYLDKARRTHDPAFLNMARQALGQSLEIQSNYLAFTTMAAVCKFAHRFQD